MSHTLTTGGVIDFSGAVHLYGEPDDRLGSGLGLLPAPPIGCLRSLLVASDASDAQSDAVYVVCRPVTVSEPIRGRADFIINALSPDVAVSAGDQTGDGFNDVLIGHLNVSSLNFELSVADLTLAITSEADISNIAVASYQVNAPDGVEAAVSGDIDGDGFADVLVGVPSAESGAGAVYILRGPLGAVSGDLEAVADLTIFGVTSEDSLGLSVSLGDVNGDGNVDLAIGGNGAAYVQRGPVSLNGVLTADLLETVVGRAGSGPSIVHSDIDIDGDGYGDFIFGTPEYQTRGQAFSVRGLGL